jgi:hypothetical protein
MRTACHVSTNQNLKVLSAIFSNFIEFTHLYTTILVI